jgi:hypothetical protein
LNGIFIGTDQTPMGNGELLLWIREPWKHQVLFQLVTRQRALYVPRPADQWPLVKERWRRCADHQLPSLQPLRRSWSDRRWTGTALVVGTRRRSIDSGHQILVMTCLVNDGGYGIFWSSSRAVQDGNINRRSIWHMDGASSYCASA